MDILSAYTSVIAEHWTVWLVTVVLIVAAVIDGFELKVPNWVTFPFILSGWAYSAYCCGWEGLGWSLAGTMVGLLLLTPLFLVGGMGAGDVKLLAGVGAWVWCGVTFHAFCVTAVVGGVLALGMVLAHRSWQHHKAQFFVIIHEFMTVRNPEKLSEIAAERKSSMRLLPYGIPIALGSILYFAYAGLLV